MEIKIDDIDQKIISFLQQDGRMTYTKIAQKTGIAEATIRHRAQRLIKNKAISIVAVCDPIQLGFPINGNIKLQVEPMKLDKVLEKMKKIDAITYIALLTGGADLDVDFVARSMDDLGNLLYNKIRKIDGIKNINTSFILSIEKEANIRYQVMSRFNQGA